jgi:hypothetical protein
VKDVAQRDRPERPPDYDRSEQEEGDYHWSPPFFSGVTAS